MTRFLRWPSAGCLLGVCLVLVLVSTGVGHAQGNTGSFPDRPNYSRGGQQQPTATLVGPWQLTQSDFERTPDAQAREAVANTLGLLFQYQSPAPQLITINVMGRTATALAQMMDGRKSYLALIQLRFKQDTWIVTEIIQQ
jgi:hypothetical protein